MKPKVLIVGAGSIGSLLAGHLSRTCEVHVLTRRLSHATALNEGGLRISGRTELFARVSASADASSLPDPDLIFFACKGVDLETAAESIAGRFPQAAVVTTQNGLGAEAIVERHGDWPIVSGVTFMSGTRHSDTHVEYVLDTATWLAPYNGTPVERVEQAVELLRASGLKAQLFPDLKQAQWSKLIFNATINSLAALTCLPHCSLFASRHDDAALGHLVADLMDEGRAIAAAAGIELLDDPWQMNVLATQRGASHFPSMLEDVLDRRPTEVELINGALVRQAERVSVAAPLHWALYRLIRARESAYRDDLNSRGFEEAAC